MENDNKKLNELIKTTEKNMKKINEENIRMKKSNTDLIYVCTNLQNKDNVYKNHILTMTEQNGKLSTELENILNDEGNIIYKLTRADYLKNVKEENRDIISSSLVELKNHFIKYGNMGANYDCSLNNSKSNNKIYLNTYNTINIDNNEIKSPNNSNNFENQNINNNDSLQNSITQNPNLINTLFQNDNRIISNKESKEEEYMKEKQKLNKNEQQNIDENKQYSEDEEQVNIEKISNE